MAERTHETGFRAEAGRAERVIGKVSADVAGVIKSNKEHCWSGEQPLEDISVKGIFSATENLLHAYKGSDSDPNYPCTFYLDNGNDSIGVRFQPDSDEQIIEVVSADKNGLSSFTPLLELSGVTGEVTAFHKIDYSETRYETVPVEQTAQALEAIAAVVGAARWGFVYGSDARYDREKEVVKMLEASFAKRQNNIDGEQKSLDDDQAMFQAISKYHGSDVAATIMIQAQVRVDGTKVAASQYRGDQANKYDLVTGVLSDYVRNMGSVALSDPEVKVAIRLVSDLKRPLVIDVKKDERLYRWGQKYLQVYHGIADPSYDN